MHPFLSDLPDLPAELDRLLAQIPYGRVTTYGDTALALGDVKAARWVAEALNAFDGHAHSENCSCHRVVRKTGEVGSYLSGDVSEKCERLRAEGVPVYENRADMNCHWGDFRCSQPLRRLAELQDEIARSVREIPVEGVPEVVAGVDAAFAGKHIITTCVTLSFPELAIVGEWSHVAKVQFPYIPGYLAFRELPALWTLWEQIHAQSPPDLILVDGNGRLHPRRAGIASCFGVMTGVPTIGIGKSLLCGRVDRLNETQLAEDFVAHSVLDGDEWLADRITRQTRSKPIYASVGHLIDRDSMRELMPRLFRDRRLPEAIYQADRLSKKLK